MGGDLIGIDAQGDGVRQTGLPLKKIAPGGAETQVREEIASRRLFRQTQQIRGRQEEVIGVIGAGAGVGVLADRIGKTDIGRDQIRFGQVVGAIRVSLRGVGRGVKGQDRDAAGDGAVRIGNDDRVGTRIAQKRRVHRQDGQGRAGKFGARGQISAIDLPLIAQRFGSESRHAEGGGKARKNVRLIGRLRGDDRQGQGQARAAQAEDTAIAAHGAVGSGSIQAAIAALRQRRLGSAAVIDAAEEGIQHGESTVGSHLEHVAVVVGAAVSRGTVENAIRAGQQTARTVAVNAVGKLIKRRQKAIRSQFKNGAVAKCAALRCGAVEIAVSTLHQRGHRIRAIRAAGEII